MEEGQEVSLEITNSRILDLNYKIYKLQEQFQKLQEQRAEVYTFIRKFRSFLASKFPMISPVGITKEISFQPINIISYEMTASFDDEELQKFLSKANSDLEEKLRFLSCQHRCFLEAELAYAEMLLSLNLIAGYYEANAIRAGIKQKLSDGELADSRILYYPQLGDNGGPISHKVEYMILLSFELKKLLDEMVFSPRHIKPMGQISQFDAIYLYKRLENVIEKRKELEAASLLDIRMPKVQIKYPFKEDPLYKEICNVEP